MVWGAPCSTPSLVRSRAILASSRSVGSYEALLCPKRPVPGEFSPLVPNRDPDNLIRKLYWCFSIGACTCLNPPGTSKCDESTGPDEKFETVVCDSIRIALVGGGVFPF